ncbi:MGMT family protein [Methanoculleus sp. FWC-SCC1]|uniref:Methylated-DNA--protein-cysteine methyltransferase n=1 Tax=Methanoculleus frigidifontis TaxID=2584085 RepID=A0ABT8MCT3_9EURY|nr:MGMT family protein [Methanoculleus sp. FWC-SCC1]MDN7025734.1 MGMT family protein [Methanoculleus sp. FWC-SCC1]
MEVITGSCRLGLWFVHAAWGGNRVYRVRFAREGLPGGDVPVPLRRYCAGMREDLTTLESPATEADTVTAAVYRAVRRVPYGETATYGEIAALVGTAPRVVGMAMAHNPTPLVIPCHRIVARDGIGGFSPELAIKEHLLAMERENARKNRRV